MVDAQQEAAIGAAINNLGIVWVGHDMAALAAGGGFPVACADRVAQGRTAADTCRGIVLLAAQEAEGEGVVDRDPVHLRRRLVALRRPAFTAVITDVGAAIVRLDHAQRVLGVDPQVVVVTMGGRDGGECLAPVLRLVKTHVEHVDHVLVGRVGVDPRVVPGTLAQLAFLVDPDPGLAGVAGAKHAALGRFHDRVKVVRPGRGDRYAGDAQRRLGHSFLPGQRFPAVTTVGALPQPAALAARFQAVRRADHAPGAGIEHARVDRVHGEVDRAGLIVNEKNPLPADPAVPRAIHASLLVGPEQVAHHGCVHQVRIFRMCADTRNVATVGQANVTPGLARVGTLPHTVPVGDVAAHGFLAGAHVNHVRVPLRNRNRADRAAEETVRHVVPVSAAVGGLPHTAAGGAEVVGFAILWNAGYRGGAAAPVRAYLAPFEAFEVLSIPVGSSRCAGSQEKIYQPPNPLGHCSCSTVLFNGCGDYGKERGVPGVIIAMDLGMYRCAVGRSRTSSTVG